MHGLPQIRLRTIFVLFFCAAFGLAIGTSPKVDHDPLFTILGWEYAELNWHYALLAAGSMLVVIGLLHEAAVLRKFKAAATSHNEAAFAVTFALAWRIAVCCTLGLCLVTAMLISRRLLRLPESEAAFGYMPFPYAIWVLCLIVVLTAQIQRWRRRGARRSRPLEYFIVCLAGLIIAALLLPDAGLIHFLVHVATSGIEAAQPPSHHWPGGFPDHRAEGFRTFWISVAAAGVVDLAIMNFALLANFGLNRRLRLLVGICGVALPLLAGAGFCVWYYGFELHRVSPYLAAAGTAGDILEWCAGILIIVILISAAAHRATVSEHKRFAVTSTIAKRPNAVLLHESFLCLSLLMGAVVVYLVEVVRTLLSMPTSVIASAEVVLAMLRDPGAILMVAILLLSLQLGWLRWRRRAEHVDWEIAAIEPRRFLWNWIAISIISCVAIPTISAFVFAFWLGPWYLYGP
jgi:hypothetical protein